MLSKLDFEEKEKTSAQMKKERDEGKGGKVKKKKDKPVTMSLEQFNNLTVEQVTFSYHNFLVCVCVCMCIYICYIVYTLNKSK